MRTYTASVGCDARLNTECHGFLQVTGPLDKLADLLAAAIVKVGWERALTRLNTGGDVCPACAKGLVRP